MSKFIIDNRSDADDALALQLVQKVVENGRISNDGKQFCYYTIFTSEDVIGTRHYGVATDLNRCSDRFTIVNTKSESGT